MTVLVAAYLDGSALISGVVDVEVTVDMGVPELMVPSPWHCSSANGVRHM